MRSLTHQEHAGHDVVAGEEQGLGVVGVLGGAVDVVLEDAVHVGATLQTRPGAVSVHLHVQLVQHVLGTQHLREPANTTTTRVNSSLTRSCWEW